MIEPPFDFSRKGSAAVTAFSVCSTSTSKALRNSVSVAPSAMALVLATRMSRPPKSCAVSVTQALSAAPSATSSARPAARTPLASSSATVDATAEASRAQMPTSTPSAASAKAMDRPMPRVPPVTSARLPFKPSSMSDHLHRLGIPALRTGYCGSIFSSVSRTMRATAALRTQLRSAGMTYQGACGVEQRSMAVRRPPCSRPTTPGHQDRRIELPALVGIVDALLQRSACSCFEYAA